jgi:hypothetical protein
LPRFSFATDRGSFARNVSIGNWRAEEVRGPIDCELVLHGPTKERKDPGRPVTASIKESTQSGPERFAISYLLYEPDSRPQYALVLSLASTPKCHADEGKEDKGQEADKASASKRVGRVRLADRVLEERGEECSQTKESRPAAAVSLRPLPYTSGFADRGSVPGHSGTARGCYPQSHEEECSKTEALSDGLPPTSTGPSCEGHLAQENEYSCRPGRVPWIAEGECHSARPH